MLSFVVDALLGWAHERRPYRGRDKDD
jgi:hypothetical protein